LALKWTFSADRCRRRCQRQFAFREIVASHNGRDPQRREAFILKQAKGLDLWRGLLVHGAIEHEVVPRLRESAAVSWDEVVERTLTLARRQFHFSEGETYRQAGMTKAKGGDAYCVLLPHVRGESISAPELRKVFEETETALRNLGAMQELWTRIGGRGKYWPELLVSVEYAGARVETRIDLLCFRGFRKPTIVEWKTYGEDTGGDAGMQTTLYAWALCRHPKWSVQKAGDVEILEAQLLTGRLVEHRCDEAGFEELEDHLFRGVEELRVMVGTGRYEDLVLDDLAFAQSPFTCMYCAFRGPCLASSPKAVEAGELATCAQGLLF